MLGRSSNSANASRKTRGSNLNQSASDRRKKTAMAESELSAVLMKQQKQLESNGQKQAKAVLTNNRKRMVDMFPANSFVMASEV